MTSSDHAIGVKLESIGLEIVALRARMREVGSSFHAQAFVGGKIVPNSEAFGAYVVLTKAAGALYSRGHSLKRLGRKIQQRHPGGANA